ncbi:MAG: N-6 DNA methylase [Chitinophagaceae bacterium]|nr:N-6 DNA methylase [Chitinophagaceae bacterium]MCW5927779.1 N-6 DNA methylase [Chitinophagaceae bacterium]
MLDNTTKKNIDDCRDVLVGKVPDPKSQIEQITLALIYKFMDDMDKEAVEKFKGKPKFFTGEYAKYGWRKLFDPSLSGQETLTLYSEALEKLNTNPNIPELFRNIFKNAYLPYRDPSTLKLFLKHINEFEYSHSEKLGDAFEYLLSVMGSQGDAGQFRTPRHIIDFVTACVNPQKSETVLDPACGTAGFLLSAYKHILQQNTEKRLGDKLKPDDRKRLATNFVGYDISPDMVRLSLANMYLHGFNTPNIHEYDTLSSEDRWQETFDVILANPPFMTPKGGIRPHKIFGVQANKAEVLFTDYIAEHLNSNGRAGIVVPNGIVATSQTAYRQLRKMLVQGSLIAVISLPAGVFQPYSGVKTSVLILDKRLAKKSQHILFLKIENDGFDLGAQRREIGKNDLPLALKTLEEYKECLSNDKVFEGFPGLATLVEKEIILRNKDVVLSGERYAENGENRITEFDFVPLLKVCEINPKKHELAGLTGDTLVSFVPMADINEDEVNFISKEIRKLSEVKTGYTYFKNNDVLIAKVTPCFENGKAGIAKDLKNGIGFGSSEFYVLRCNQTVLPMWIYLNLTTDKFRKEGKVQMSGTSGLQRVPKGFIEDFEIPLPPIEIQQQIVAEIENYQNDIEGLKEQIKEKEQKIKNKISEVWGVKEEESLSKAAEPQIAYNK